MRAGVTVVTSAFVLAAQLASFTADEHSLGERVLGRSQKPPTSDAPQDRFVWPFQTDAKLLQGQLDDLAARGYRMVSGSSYGGLFERRPNDERVRYVVLRNKRPAALQ